MRTLGDLFGLRCAACRRPGTSLCSACVSGLTPSVSGPAPGCDRVLAAFAYEGTARRLILDLKLTAARACAVPLARGMADRVMRSGLHADAITWVPGRRADIRRRGFDHAAVLARAVASLLGLPHRALLHRTGNSQDQAALSRRERFRNLEGAFTALPSEGPVALVDDLLTTGATAGACSRALLAAGSRQIEVLVAARA